MRLIHLLREAFENVRANKGRSFLTLVGIVIGISSVITILSVGFGVQAYIDGQMSALGSNAVMIAGGNYTIQTRNDKAISNGDLEEICSLPYVIDCSPALTEFKIATADNGKSLLLTVLGYSEAGISMGGDELVRGRAYTDEEVRNAEPVIVIWNPVGERLFPDAADGVIGRKIRIDHVLYEIVGEYYEGGFGQSMADQMNYASAPYTTMQLRMSGSDRHHFDRMLAYVDESQLTVEEAMKRIETVLRRRHDIPAGKPADFMITTSKEMLRLISVVTTTFLIFLSGVAAISLLVAGIGIMNIMLVTVTERTREIGLRKAVGARNRDILTQFLFESAYLSLLGGLFGMTAGLLASFGLTAALRAFASGFESLQVVVKPGVIAFTVFFAAVFGIVFGLVPARKASRLEPVLALRTE